MEKRYRNKIIIIIIIINRLNFDQNKIRRATRYPVDTVNS